MYRLQDGSKDDWGNLLSWLETFDSNFRANMRIGNRLVPEAGRCLFTTVDVPPNTPLVTIPKAAHLNAKTLSPLYGLTENASLSATQLISMHLFLHRPQQNGVSLDPIFGPYISTLPKDFDGHPLTWLILPSSETQFLLDNLPPTVTRALYKMANRFRKDWESVSNFLQHHSGKIPDFKISQSTRLSVDPIPNYLWAWLNVNTRCIYYNLFTSQTDNNNITLCPVIDFVNHISHPERATIKSPIPTLLSPSILLSSGDEIFLKYGAHSNAFLFVEYGFIERDSSDGAEADAQDIIESLFKEKGDLGKWMEEVLDSNHFWGDWKLHNIPPPTQPSYRILPALRLLELSSSLLHVHKKDDPWSESPSLQAWQATIWGEKEIISDFNEQAVWKRLAQICDTIIHRAEEGILKLHSELNTAHVTCWMRYAIQCIEYLWQEELRIARETKANIDNGTIGYCT